MSYTTVVTLIAALDAFVIAALAVVCLVPFSLDRDPGVEAHPQWTLSDLDLSLDPAFEAGVS